MSQRVLPLGWFKAKGCSLSQAACGLGPEGGLVIEGAPSQRGGLGIEGGLAIEGAPSQLEPEGGLAK